MELAWSKPQKVNPGDLLLPKNLKTVTEESPFSAQEADPYFTFLADHEKVQPKPVVFPGKKGGEAMQTLVLKILLMIFCAGGGYLLGGQIGGKPGPDWPDFIGAVLGLIFAFLVMELEKILQKIPTRTVLGAIIGFVLGLVVARLLMFPFECFRDAALLRYAVLVLLSGSLGYLGLRLGSLKAPDISRLANQTILPAASSRAAPRYILDTSVIIDGRIADICETGFIDGTLIIPQFILQELHHIADSVDALKKVRGRRGLDIIEKIQKRNAPQVVILDQNPPKDNVDAKLVDLALELNATIMTNDFNLSKVAELRGIKCLNINKLANALKPAVLSGEVLTVQIIREGKTPGQGVAYMDDGTMVVVENARRHIGRSIDAVVTSVLQTGTGRMIFAEIKNG
jgi:uncharacterized protein YacL